MLSSAVAYVDYLVSKTLGLYVCIPIFLAMADNADNTAFQIVNWCLVLCVVANNSLMGLNLHMNRIYSFPNKCLFFLFSLLEIAFSASLLLSNVGAVYYLFTLIMIASLHLFAVIGYISLLLMSEDFLEDCRETARQLRNVSDVCDNRRMDFSVV